MFTSYNHYNCTMHNYTYHEHGDNIVLNNLDTIVVFICAWCDDKIVYDNDYLLYMIAGSMTRTRIVQNVKPYYANGYV